MDRALLETEACNCNFIVDSACAYVCLSIVVLPRIAKGQFVHKRSVFSRKFEAEIGASSFGSVADERSYYIQLLNVS